MDRIYLFLALFSIVYFLEAIGGSYINSAVQNIERQFQMSSKVSGLMIAASDFGYIPCAIFTAYFGSRGNRAKWIGAGAILVSITYLMLASPNFLFPVAKPQINTTNLAVRLTPTAEQLSNTASLQQLLDYPLIRDRYPHSIYDALLNLDVDTSEIENFQAKPRNRSNHFSETYSVDGWLLDKAINESDSLTKNGGNQTHLRTLLSHYIHRRSNSTNEDIVVIRKTATAPFTFCVPLMNELRSTLKQMKCQEQSSNFYPFLVFFFSLLFLGIGRTVPWSLGVPLLDDNIKKKSLPAYFGAISSIRVLGPICGYLIASACNKIYFNLSTPPGLTPADPTWIGAWWIGFLFIGSVCLLPSILLFFFPSGTPGRNNSLNLYDVHKHKLDEHEDKSAVEKFKEFYKSCKAVVSTKLYIGSVTGRICDVLAFKGYIVFLPKYLENHFGIPQYLVHRYMALFGVFGFGLGTATGGFITRKLRLNGRRAAMFVMIVSSLNVLIYSSKIFIGCESIVNSIGLNNRESNYNFTKTCNSECSCENVKLYPVCDQTGHAYFSPCHAGCKEARTRGGPADIDFTSCECASGTVNRSNCNDTCKLPTIIFFLTVLPGAFVAGLGVVPGMLILLRCVPPETRSLSLGLQGMLVSSFGTLPSPILWGFVIDAACLVWDHTCTGDRGSCAIYHPQRLRVWMHLMYVGIRLVSLMTDIFVWYHAEHLNIMEEPVNEEKDDIRKNSIKMIQMEN